jgi:hypothetical protein
MLGIRKRVELGPDELERYKSPGEKASAGRRSGKRGRPATYLARGRDDRKIARVWSPDRAGPVDLRELSDARPRVDRQLSASSPAN